jgi:hypothetical protein
MTANRSEYQHPPVCVITWRKGPNGIEHLDAILQSSEMEAHDVATALAKTGQPTWLFVLSEHDTQRYDGKGGTDA